MKKKLLPLVGAMMLALTIGACNTKSGSNTPSGGNTSEVVTKYTVVFYVDGERYATKKVNQGDHITGVTNPSKEGYKFVGWLEGDTLVDLSTYVVTKDTEFNASFELDEGDVLSVDDKKEAGKDYYLVFGWWEDSDSASGVSKLTKPDVRVFYDNVRRYLKAKTPASTDADLANIQFRNYSSENVASLGELVNADADADILIGVGGNINTIPNPETDTKGAGVLLYDDNNPNYKVQLPMGSTSTKRYMACTQYASELGASVYNWINGSATAKASLIRTLTDDEIAETLAPVTANLKVTVHGNTNVVTELNDADTPIVMPEFTVGDDQAFLGFSTTEAGALALEVNPDEVLKLEDVQELVEKGSKTLDLYPVIVHANLIVYMQLQGTNLTAAEADLFMARARAAFPGKDLVFKNRVVSGGDEFTKRLGKDADIVIGGNTPVGGYEVKDSEHYPTVSAGAKHFAAKNARKICLIKTVKDGHLDLAKSLYTFASTAAEELEFHAAYWPNGGSWVLDGGKATIDGEMRTRLNTYLSTTDEEGKRFEDKYNVKFTTVTVEGSDVATLGADTRALRDGAGTDLIIGCGKNVGTTGGMSVIAKKIVTNNGLASGRYVALIHENPLAREIYNNYFLEAQS